MQKIKNILINLSNSIKLIWFLLFKVKITGVLIKDDITSKKCLYVINSFIRGIQFCLLSYSKENNLNLSNEFKISINKIKNKVWIGLYHVMGTCCCAYCKLLRRIQ